MEAALVELAVSAGSVLIKAVTTEGYEAVKKAVLGVWQRHAPAQAEMIEESLDNAHAELAEAAEADVAQVAQDLDSEWLTFFRTLLRTHPDAADDVRQLVTDLKPLIVDKSAQSARDITQTASVQGGIVIQAGNTVGNVNIGRNEQP